MELDWGHFRENLVAWTDVLRSKSKYPHKSYHHCIQPREEGNKVNDMLLPDCKRRVGPSQLANEIAGRERVRSTRFPFISLLE